MTQHALSGPPAPGDPAPQPAPAGPSSAPAPRSAGPLELPARRDFWVWVWASVRPLVGWILALLGAVALFLGWWGVSGQALTAKQLPYLISGGLVGIALIVLAAVFLATEDWRRQMKRLDALEHKIDELHHLLTTDVPIAPGTPPATAPAPRAAARSNPAVSVVGPVTLALPTGTVYHRAGCALIAGKAAAAPVDAAAVAERGLAPCRVCDPPAPTG